MGYEQRLKFYVPEQLREPKNQTIVDIANSTIDRQGPNSEQMLTDNPNDSSENSVDSINNKS